MARKFSDEALEFMEEAMLEGASEEEAKRLWFIEYSRQYDKARMEKILENPETHAKQREIWRKQSKQSYQRQKEKSRI